MNVILPKPIAELRKSHRFFVTIQPIVILSEVRPFDPSTMLRAGSGGRSRRILKTRFLVALLLGMTEEVNSYDSFYMTLTLIPTYHSMKSL